MAPASPLFRPPATHCYEQVPGSSAEQVLSRPGLQSAGEALLAAERAKQLQPEHARITFAVAQLHRQMKNWTPALQNFTLALELEPAENLCHRARCASVQQRLLITCDSVHRSPPCRLGVRVRCGQTSCLH
jgi:hypothetical protein